MNVKKESEDEIQTKEMKEEIVEKSISLAEEFDKSSKEENISNEEASVDYSDFTPATIIKETGLEDTEAEDKNRVESCALVSEEKDMVETETREIMLNDGENKLTPEAGEDRSELRSTNPEEETEEKAEQHKVDEQYEQPELENKKEVKSFREEIKLTSDICSSTTLQDAESSDLRSEIEETKDEKSFEEAIKSIESSNVQTAVAKTIIEQENVPERNLQEGATEEKAMTEQKDNGNLAEEVTST